jgi:hypothetical protein
VSSRVVSCRLVSSRIVSCRLVSSRVVSCRLMSQGVLKDCHAALAAASTELPVFVALVDETVDTEAPAVRRASPARVSGPCDSY